MVQLHTENQEYVPPSPLQHEKGWQCPWFEAVCSKGKNKKNTQTKKKKTTTNKKTKGERGSTDRGRDREKRTQREVEIQTHSQTYTCTHRHTYTKIHNEPVCCLDAAQDTSLLLLLLLCCFAHDSSFPRQSNTCFVWLACPFCPSLSFFGYRH